jgi:hypothetical protein
MKKPSDMEASSLYWEQPRILNNQYILVGGVDSLARIELKMSATPSAVALAGEKRWFIKQVGFLSPHVTVQEDGGEGALAVYTPGWISAKGVIKFASGVQYQWQATDIWSSKYVISDRQGVDLVTFISGSRNKSFSNFFKQQAQVIIGADAWRINELTILVLLGWYLILLYEAEQSTLATSIAVMN